MTVTQLRRRLASALDEVQAGRSYVITRHGVPIARLVPVFTSPPAVIPAKLRGGWMHICFHHGRCGAGEDLA